MIHTFAIQYKYIASRQWNSRSKPNVPTFIPFATSAGARPEIAVIGAGAAGLAAAYFAADSGAKVTIFEKTQQAGQKILISGGKRSNVLPGTVDIGTDYYTESSSSALRYIFSRWSLDDCKEWISSPDQLNIPLVLELETNKFFPASNQAKEVRDKLVDACRHRGAIFIPSSELIDLEKGPNNTWKCIFGTNQSSTQESLPTPITTFDRVILATGGKSFPTLGTIGTGYDILKHRLGLTVRNPYAALTPLLGTHPGGAPLPGVSIYTAKLWVKLPGKKQNSIRERSNKKKVQSAERSDILLTHRGFSGPATMDLSHYISMVQDRMYVEDPQKNISLPEIYVSWIKDMDADAWQRCFSQEGSSSVLSVLRKQGLAQRLAEALCIEAGIPEGRKTSEIRREERIKLLNALTAYKLNLTGHEGYAKAEVTGGGLALEELDCSTMESKRAPGIHVCGELCDVHGRIGGFNFYWAWCSGRLAGLGASATTTMN